VFAAEWEVLRAHGGEVRVYALHSSAIASMGRIGLAASAVWNQRLLRDLSRLLENGPPDVVHFDNTVPLMPPAAYFAAGGLRTTVVQTLHNFACSA
jgi:hypothetical protein